MGTIPRNRGGRPRLYPWEEWFAAGTVTIRRGADYKCSQSVMAQSIRTNASQRKLSVRIRDLEDAFTITVVPAHGDGHYNQRGRPRAHPRADTPTIVG